MEYNDKNKVTIAHYHADDSMCLLICDNPQMLFVLNRFGIPLGFAEKSIGEVCVENNVHTSTFLAVVNILLCGDKSEHIDYSEIDPIALVQYLKKSHDYYLGYRLPRIRKSLKEVIGSIAGDMTELLIRYFDEYSTEVEKHLKYEEEVVFPHVERLLAGNSDDGYRIDIFSSNHDNIDIRLTELKDILIKYFRTPGSYEIIEVLDSIFMCAEDLVYHTIVEDCLFVPLIKTLEGAVADTSGISIHS